MQRRSPRGPPGTPPGGQPGTLPDDNRDLGDRTAQQGRQTNARAEGHRARVVTGTEHVLRAIRGILDASATVIHA